MRFIAPMTLLALLLAVAAPAHGQGALSEATRALDSNPVYVDESAERALTDSEVERLRDQIRERGAGPLYLVVLPESAGDEAGVDVPASELARESLDARGTDGTFAVLSDFIARVGEARSGGGGSSGGGGDGGGGFPWFLALLIGLPLAAIALGRRRQHKREQEYERAQLEEVRQVARDDLVALGDDIRALDLDVQMPDADPEAKQHYGQAVERYTEAEQALDRVQRREDSGGGTPARGEARWAMPAAKEELAGRQAPERRPPCFFDPRHGPSVGDVEWAPPGGQPRPVPVCAADLQRVQDGLDPESRQVPMDGQMVPYWAAGPAYMPWAGGFFGAGLLPGLFVGSALGGGFGMFGGVGDAMGGGDFGGGDLGDFGGGDFGDFGGGDF